jgi:hypothetical protein
MNDSRRTARAEVERGGRARTRPTTLARNLVYPGLRKQNARGLYFNQQVNKLIHQGLRMARRSMLADVELEATSTFIGAELAIKAMLKGYRVGEVGIQTFPRRFGRWIEHDPALDRRHDRRHAHDLSQDVFRPLRSAP